MAKKNAGRNVGTHKKHCEAYRAKNRRNINKAKKLLRRLRKFPQDLPVLGAAKKLIEKDPSVKPLFVGFLEDIKNYREGAHGHAQ